MGVALALLAMLCFASNILLTRRALAYMPVESGFLVVLATKLRVIASEPRRCLLIGQIR